MFCLKQWRKAGYIVCVIFSACTQVDDYILGKDNTPAPKPLDTMKNKIPLKLDWSVLAGGKSNRLTYLKLTPVVKNNIVYTADSHGQVESRDSGSGELRWATQLKHGVLSGPSVGEAGVALGTDASSLVVLNKSDGHKIWQAKLSGDVLAQPLIMNHSVFVKTVDGTVVSLAMKNGEKQWSLDHGSPQLILQASSSPVQMGSKLLVGFSDGKLESIDQTTGHSEWQRGMMYPRGSSDVERLVDIDADPIVHQDTVYLASYQSSVGAWQLTDGQSIWTKPVSVYKNMAIDTTTLYMVDRHDTVWAIARSNGMIKWKNITLKARGVTAPVLIGSWLIVGDHTGNLHVLDVQTGNVLARISLPAAIDSAPAASGHNIYVMTADGRLNRLTVGA